MKKGAVILLTTCALLTAAAPALALNWPWSQGIIVTAGPVKVRGAAFTDTADSPARNAFTLLAALEIVRGGPEGDLGKADPGGEVSRAEIAATVVRLLGREALAEVLAKAKAPSGFEDAETIPKWALGYASAAESLQLMRGLPGKGDSPLGRFAASAPVRHVDALVILLRALGHEPLLEDKGTYPDRYLDYARKVGLSGGVETAWDQPLTRQDLALLLVNALGLERYNADQKRFVPADALLDTDFLRVAGMVEDVDAVQGWIRLRKENGAGVKRYLAGQVFVPGLSEPRNLRDLKGRSVWLAEKRNGSVVYIAVQP